ncbi:hypothetical protein CA598_15160 [Paenibacillus sp. VTT E-133291]|nr:hypothetical protein CA598_15160 [Paenibacillus sp. VTT E-133291]
MMKQTNLVPKRRFREFQDNDAWEQRKLGEIAEKVSVGIATSSSEYFTDRKKGVPFIKNQNIKQNRIDDSDLEFISKDFDQANSTKRVKTGDILTVRTGYPGLSAVVPAHLNGAQTFTTLITRLKEKQTLPEFVSTFINSNAGMRQITGMEAGGAQKNVNAGTLQNLFIPIPSFDEQKMVTKFFKCVDDLITLHQCKLDKTKALKSAYLSEMFPAEGESVPKRRFAGFIDAWEQREVGEFYDFKNGLNKGKEYFGKGTPIVNFTDVFHNRGIDSTQLRGKVELTDKEIRNFEVRQGDIFFTRTSETIEEIGYPSVMLDAPKDTVFSGFVLRGRAKDNDPLTNIFKRYVFFTDVFRNEMQKKSSMTTRALTSGTAIKEMCFSFPVSKEEQDKIGQFFANLDNLITLHQRKLEKLQNIKKAYLNEMFV